VDGGLFDKIDQIGRNLRDPSKPFGGLQVSCFDCHWIS
jgi:hypothetical protein